MFQFQIKLFNEWYPTWSKEEKERLLKKISELDPDFSNKLHDTLFKGAQVNGDENDSDIINTENCTESSLSQQNADKEVENQTDDNREFPTSNQENVSIEITAAS